MAQYYVGTLVRVTATFTNSSGAVADPSTVQFKVKTPSGVETDETYGGAGTVTKDSTGVYHRDVSLTEAGAWWVGWVSTGDPQVSVETEVDVLVSQFA